SSRQCSGTCRSSSPNRSAAPITQTRSRSACGASGAVVMCHLSRTSLAPGWSWAVSRLAGGTVRRMKDRPLWVCPRCARTFANVNQTHTCAVLGDLERHFAGKAPEVRACFDRVLEVVRALGRVTVLPEKTRIALHVRMSFAAFTPRTRWLDG